MESGSSGNLLRKRPGGRGFLSYFVLLLVFLGVVLALFVAVIVVGIAVTD